MGKKIILSIFQIMLVHFLNAQVQTDSLIKEMPLGTKILLQAFGEKKLLFYNGEILNVKREKRGEFIVSSAKKAKAGAVDTLKLFSGKDTIKYVFIITKPVPKIRLKDFYEHIDSYGFLHAKYVMMIDILGLDKKDQLLNKIKLRKAVFCHYGKDSLKAKYVVDNSTIDTMFSDLQKKYRPGDNLVLSEVNFLINDFAFTETGNFFNYVFK